MGEKIFWGFVGGLVAYLLLILLIVATDRTAEDHYKRGQSDALSGIIKYEKVTHENQTVTWEKIKGGE